jgi:hypothetical protein
VFKDVTGRFRLTVGCDSDAEKFSRHFSVACHFPAILRSQGIFAPFFGRDADSVQKL